MVSERAKCHGCGSIPTPMWDGAKGQIISKYRTCRPCADSHKTSYWDFPYDYDKVMHKHGYVWLDRHPDYPVAFIGTEISKLSEGLQRMTDWKPGEKASLLLHGTTGTGKTRAAWLVFNDIWLQNFPDKAVWLPMRKLEMAIEKGFEDHKHGAVLDYFCTVPLLSFDDLGKERLTARMESDLFAILDERTSNLRPTIITTNYNGTTLLDRFNNKETGEALLRRIREYFTAVHA